jgi:exosome complex component CSL4
VSVDNERRLQVKHWRRRVATGAALVPQVGSVISGRVTRITATQANVDIVCCGGTVLPQPAPGVIRVEDVFPATVDHTSVQMSNCFRPGDVIQARLTSIGDSKQYWLSTAEPALGVAWARGSDGDVLLPVAWDEVVSPATGAKQSRKAARPADDDDAAGADADTSGRSKKAKQQQ